MNEYDNICIENIFHAVLESHLKRLLEKTRFCKQLYRIAFRAESPAQVERIAKLIRTTTGLEIDFDFMDLPR